MIKGRTDIFKAIIIDDEKYGIDDLLYSLHWNLYQFTVIATFQDPLKALDYIIIHNPDVVFTDIKMRGMLGIDLIRSARDNNYKGEFVIVSGYSSFEYAKAGIQNRVAGYLLKPIDRKEAQALLLTLKDKLDANAPNIHKEHRTCSKRLEEILSYIEGRLGESTTLQDVADNFHVSVSYIVKMFRTELNTTFIRYLTEQKIEHAKYLLKNTDIPIADIADMLKFTDCAYFTKVFKEYSKSTPKEYRLNEKNEQYV